MLPSIRPILQKINDFDRFVLIGHKNPDGDAVGSLTGLALGLEAINKQVEILLCDPVPKTFLFLPAIGRVKRDIGTITNKHLVILVDCAKLKRTGFEDLEGLSYNNVVSIDHHLIEEGDIDGLKNPEASATAEIIYELLGYLGIEINNNIATCLLTGILTDTGGFQHSNTNSKTLKVTAKLLARGVPLTKISKAVFQKKDIGILKIWGRALARIKIDPEIKMATSVITQDDMDKSNLNPSEISGVSSMMNTAREINFALLLTELNNTTKGSLRSEKGRGIDVAEIAKLFNGGGHKLAAGFEVKGGLKKNISEISRKIVKRFKS